MSRDAPDHPTGRRPSLADLFAQLSATDPDPETLERARSVAADDGESWYLQALSFGGAWLSAVFLAMTLLSLAGLVGVPESLAEHSTTWLVTGAALLAAALRLDRSHGDTLFVGHFTGALGVAGLASLAAGTAMFGEHLFADLLDWNLDNWFGVGLAAALAAGSLYAAVALRRHRGDSRLFPQLAFATSALGQTLAMVAGHGAHEQIFGGDLGVGWPAVFLVETAVAALLYRCYDSDFHRFLTALLVSGLALAALFDFPGADQGLGVPRSILLASLFALETATVAVVFSPSRWIPLSTRLTLRPLGYACALSIAALSSELFLLKVADVGTLWPYCGVMAAALIYLIYAAVHTSDTSPLEPALWGAGATLALAVVSTPGVLVGLLLLFIGAWRLQGWFFALGIVTLGFHLIVFYYLMELTLYDKSLMLMATGAILLALRAWFVHRPWYATEASR